MRSGPLTLRKVFWLACASALVVPCLAAAQSPRPVDFDGDGRRDQFMLDPNEARIVQVWLSASDTTQFIHARRPLLQVIAVDLDGDHKPELVARDARSHIHVWTRKQERFRSVRPRKGVHLALNERRPHRLEDKDDDRPGVITNTPFVPLALLLSASPSAPGCDTSTSRASRPAAAIQSIAALAPFAPRPPPAHSLM